MPSETSSTDLERQRERKRKHLLKLQLELAALDKEVESQRRGRSHFSASSSVTGSNVERRHKHKHKDNVSENQLSQQSAKHTSTATASIILDGLFRRSFPSIISDDHSDEPSNHSSSSTSSTSSSSSSYSASSPSSSSSSRPRSSRSRSLSSSTSDHSSKIRSSHRKASKNKVKGKAVRKESRTRKASRESGRKSRKDIEELRRFVKELKFDDQFHPLHENQLDDQLDKAYLLAGTKGYKRDILPKAILDISSPEVLHTIYKHNIHHITDHLKFRDALAKALFPYSRQMEEVYQDITEENRREDVVAMTRWFQKRIARYELLRHRWHLPQKLHRRDKCQAYMKKLPVELEGQAFTTKWRKMDLDDLIDKVMELHDNNQRHSESLRRHNNFAMTTSAPTGTTQSTEKPAPEKRTCIWCHQSDHISKDCKNKPPCEKCGKKGHRAEICFTHLLPGKLSTQMIQLLKTARGVNMNVKEDTSNVTVLQNIAELVNSKLAKAQAAVQRAAKSTPSNPLVNDSPSTSPPVSMGDIGPNVVQHVVEGRCFTSRKDVLYGRFIIADVPMYLLIDTGANINVLSWDTFLKLPLEHRVRWRPAQAGAEFQLSSLTGDAIVKGKVNLPVHSPLNSSEEEFYVVAGPKDTNIIGMGHLRRHKGMVIDLTNGFLRLGERRMGLVEAVDLRSASAHATTAMESASIDDIRRQCSADLKDADVERILDICLCHQSVWQMSSLGSAKHIVYDIDTQGAAPVVSANRHYSAASRREIQRQDD